MPPEMKIGERWRFQNQDNDVIVEVESLGCRILQILGKTIGSVGDNIGFPYATDIILKNVELSGPNNYTGTWTYLNGQDKPEYHNVCEYKNSCGA